VENALPGLFLEAIMGQSYRELIAWQKAMDLVMEIYAVTRTFPRDEVYALAGQLRKAAVFVPTNIAEGQARYSAQEFHFFLGRARGSLVEIETELLIAQNLNYISTEQAQKLLDKAAELGRVLNGLATSIKPAA
jgi:four helix bundle protein